MGVNMSNPLSKLA